MKGMPLCLRMSRRRKLRKRELSCSVMSRRTRSRRTLVSRAFPWRGSEVGVKRRAASAGVLRKGSARNFQPGAERRTTSATARLGEEDNLPATCARETGELTRLGHCANSNCTRYAQLLRPVDLRVSLCLPFLPGLELIHLLHSYVNITLPVNLTPRST